MVKPLWATRKRTISQENIEIRRTKLFELCSLDNLLVNFAPDSWANLPREVLILIFSYIPLDQIPCMSTVNRQWCSVAWSEFLWKQLHFKHFGGPRFDGRSWRFHCFFAMNEQETIRKFGSVTPIFKPDGSPDKMRTVAHSDGSFSKVQQSVFEMWMWAADRGHYKVLQAMWDSQMITDLEIRDPITRRTALYRTVQGGHLPSLQWLISAGADPEARRDELATPLFCASSLGNLEIVKCLVNAEVDVNGAGRAGGTPLIMACQNRRIDVIHYLLGTPQCDVNEPLRDGETPLFIASMLGFVDVIEILLNNGADVNKARYTGSTPFWIACKQGQLAVVKQLARVPVVDKSVMVQGISCVEIALRKHHFDVANYLIKHLRADWSTLPPTGVLFQQMNRNLM